MKKLVIVNHLGEIVREVDVFLEGQDTELIWPTPTAIWLGSILVYDLDRYEAYKESLSKGQPLAVEPEPEPTQDEIDEHEAEVIGKSEPEPEPIEKAEAKELLSQFPMGPDEEKEVEPDDPETASDKGTGVEGASEAEQLTRSAQSFEKPTYRKAAKRSKRVRGSKAA